MAKKKSEQIGQAIGFVVGLAMVAALLAAAVLPIFLLFRYLQHRYLAYKLRKDYDMAENGWWLSMDERNSFKESCAAENARLATNRREHATLENLINIEHVRAQEAGLPTTNWGKYSRHSNLGKEIQGKIDELEDFRKELDLNEYEISCRQPIEFWDELNNLLKKQNLAFFALLGWACGAFFFYSAYQQGAPVEIWFDVFAAALCAGVGACLAFLFSRNPAVRYMPKPEVITIDNVDSPTMELPQRRRFILRYAGICVWFGLMVFAGQEGSKHGKTKAIANREQLKRQSDLAAENERQMQQALDLGHSWSESAAVPSVESQTDGASRSDPDATAYEKIRNTVPEMRDGVPILLKGFTVKDIANDKLLERLNAGEIEEIILAIYANRGAEFESRSAQAWANRQTWYRRVPGRNITEAEKTFNETDEYNVEQLVKRWNEIQVEDGLAPVPVDESPLAGRGISPDSEGESKNTSVAVLKALPVSESSMANQGNLSAEEIGKWTLARVRYEINTIYARHGVVFPKREIQAYFESKDWYKPIPGRGLEDAEKLFSPSDKVDIELLAARRLALTESR